MTKRKLCSQDRKKEELDRERKRGNRELRVSFSFLYYGKDCWSLAVTIGAGMNLHSILPHSTRRIYKLGLLSLTKYNLRLLMEFLDPQAILPSSRAKKDFVAPSPLPRPPNLFLHSCPPPPLSYNTCLFRYSVVEPSPPSVFDSLLLSVWMFERWSFLGFGMLSSLFSGWKSRQTLSCCTHRC
jgi:hypothetical protein